MLFEETSKWNYFGMKHVDTYHVLINGSYLITREERERESCKMIRIFYLGIDTKRSD